MLFQNYKEGIFSIFFTLLFPLFIFVIWKKKPPKRKRKKQSMRRNTFIHTNSKWLFPYQIHSNCFISQIHLLRMVEHISPHKTSCVGMNLKRDGIRIQELHHEKKAFIIIITLFFRLFVSRWFSLRLVTIPYPPWEIQFH